MRRTNRRHAVAFRVYAKRRVEFLESNPNCVRCKGTATQIHHMAGRIGGALLNESRWASMCAWCHLWVTEHPAQAIADGYSLPRIGVNP